MTTDDGSVPCSRCGADVHSTSVWGAVTWQARPYCSVECSVRHEREDYDPETVCDACGSDMHPTAKCWHKRTDPEAQR